MKIEIAEESLPPVPEIECGQIYSSGDKRFHMVVRVDYQRYVIVDLNGGNRRYEPKSLTDLQLSMTNDPYLKFRLFTGTLKLTVGGSDD